MTTSRQAYRIDEGNPGSDLAGETAAAMAAASIVFRKINPHYSHLLLHHAQQVKSENMWGFFWLGNKMWPLSFHQFLFDSLETLIAMDGFVDVVVALFSN